MAFGVVLVFCSCLVFFVFYEVFGFFFLSLLGNIISRKRTRREGRKKKDREADTERRDDEEKETEEERYILSYTERKK